MKKTRIIKISAILLISILFFTSIIPQGFSQKTVLQKTQATKALVPVWDVGTIWTYDLKDIDIDLEGLFEGFDLEIEGSINELILKVEDETSDEYLLSFQCNLKGKVSFWTTNGTLMKATGKTSLLNNPKIEGELILNKENMFLKDLDIEFSGGFLARLNRPIPSPALRLPLRISLSTSFDPPIVLLSFPIEPEKVWWNNASEVTIDGSLQTIYLRVINIIHNIARLLRLVPEELMQISDILHKLLPVIDFSDTLYEFMGVNSLALPPEQYMFGVLNTEEVTVEAGTFNCYNITPYTAFGFIYYSPEIGNIVKLSGNIHYLLPSEKPITLSLISMQKP